MYLLRGRAVRQGGAATLFEREIACRCSISSGSGSDGSERVCVTNGVPANEAYALSPQL